MSFIEGVCLFAKLEAGPEIIESKWPFTVLVLGNFLATRRVDMPSQFQASTP